MNAPLGDSQKRAIKKHRARLNKRGLARFEVLGLNADRNLIRALARRLAENGPDAPQLRAVVAKTVAGEPRKKGGVLAALRNSPLAGIELDLSRSREKGRKVEL